MAGMAGTDGAAAQQGERARESADCYHCGLPLPPGASYPVEIDGEQRPMCCPGCQAVARAIVDGGLTDFYRHRQGTTGRRGDLIPEALRDVEVYDRPRLQERLARDVDGRVREASLILEGIVCAACVWLNERHVSALPGVVDFQVNYATHRARVRWDPDRIRLSDIIRAIADIGYLAHPFDPSRQEQVQRRERSQALRRLAVAGIGAMQVMMLAIAMYAGDHYGMELDLRRFMRWISLLIALPVVFYSARPFFVSALGDLRRRRPGMDVPVSLAIGGAFLASLWATVSGGGEVYFDSVTMFTFFLLAGRYLEMGARHRAGQAAEALVRVLPATAVRLDDAGREQTVAAAELAPGDRIRVRPGDAVPADGVIVAGRSALDESLLTGESLPVGRGPGEAVVAGAVNRDSPIEVRVERVGEDTVLAAIVRLLDRAQAEKPRIAALADRVAAWFVGALLLFAGLVWVYWWRTDPDAALWVTLSVLVVTCPCALSLATPAALTAATGRLTRLGLLTTRGHALEHLARATHVVFDKTGTLTRGRLRLIDVEVSADASRETCLRVAAGLEQGSEHPIARALVEAAGEPEPVAAIENTPGEGVEGVWQGRRLRLGREDYALGLGAARAPGREAAADPHAGGGPGATVVLADAGKVWARFRFEDTPRPEAAAAVAELAALGLQVELLSGDAPRTVAALARELGIRAYRGGQRPADKLGRIRELQAAGAVVAMVGDGINDAPVLAGSQVSIAMGGGTELAHASADMVLLSERLDHIPEGVRTARATLRVIRENLAWAVAYNVIALPLAAAGMVAPWMAAIGMSSSSLIVVLNALRLTRDRRPDPARRPHPPAPGEARTAP